MTYRLSLIVAMDCKLMIGTENGLPWHLPADLKRFRKLTWGKPIIMGRKTHEFIGRPLPGRPNIVLTRHEDYHPEGVHVVHSVDEALRTAEGLLGEAGAEVFVIGGAEIYAQLFDRVEAVYLTILDGEFAGTTRFPFELLSGVRWVIRHQESHPADEKNPHRHTFYELERAPSGVSSPSDVHQLSMLISCASP
jgi:dihydrofolate reductase